MIVWRGRPRPRLLPAEAKRDCPIPFDSPSLRSGRSEQALSPFAKAYTRFPEASENLSHNLNVTY
jgi:hypothetical protein